MKRMVPQLLIFSALTAGLAAGRKYLGREITTRKNAAIEAAAIETRARIRKHATDLLAKTFRHFAIVTGIKLTILTTVWTLHRFGRVDEYQFSVVLGTCIFLFILRDIKVIWPVVKLCWVELQRHGWKPKRALSETIAARVFQDVLAEAAAVPQTQANKLMLMLAGENPIKLQLEIANAVADVARQTSWPDLRPFLVSSAVRTVSLMILYTASVAALFTL